MRTTRWLVTLILAALWAGSQVSSAAADGPPKLNVGPSCDSAASGSVSIGRDKEACMSDERAAREELSKGWPNYPSADKTQCIGMTSQGGSASYVELISCLEIMRDAAAIKKSDPLSGSKDPSGSQRSNRSR